MAVYYPSCVANLRIRFEPSLLPGGTEMSPTSVADLSSATVSLPANPSAQPGLMSGQADRFSRQVGIVPRGCSVEIPGYRQAGKFSLDFEFRDFPLDSRAVRALGVEIYLDAIQPGDYAQGMTQQVITDQFGRPVPANSHRSSVLTPSDSNLVVIGLADTICTEHSGKGSNVHIEGRDLRGLLLDVPVRPELLNSLNLKNPIHIVVAEIITKHPLLSQQPFNVEVFDNDWPNNTIPNLAVQGDLLRVQLGAQGNKPTVQTQGDPNKLNFWDIITQYCFLVGGIPHFIGRTLRIRPARSLFDAQRQDFAFDPANGATPFLNGVPREVVTGQGSLPVNEKFSYRRMVYGSNIETLKFERKLAGIKVPVVECYTVDTSNQGRGKTNRLISARWPDSVPGQSTVKEAKAKVTSVSPSGQASMEDVIRVPVNGINSKDRLREIAHQIYEEVGRGEIGGSCSTKDLSSFGGDNSDPDLLRLRPGDPVEFREAAGAIKQIPPLVSELTNKTGMSLEELTAEIQKRIGDADIARILAVSIRGSVPALQRTFRVGNVKFSWDKEAGVGIDFDFQNYVETRYDADPTHTAVKSAIQNV